MNPSHHQSNALFAVPASLSSFLIAAALTCGFAPGQDTQFQGLTHRSVGNAQLSINPTGHLVVSVGSPGPAADGVEVLLPSGVGPVLEHEVFMDPIDPMGSLPIGASLTLTSRGTVNGARNQTVSTFAAVKQAGGVDYTADFSFIGATSQRIDLYESGQLVLSVSGHPNGSGAVSGRGWLDCFLNGCPPDNWSPTFGSSVMIAVPGHRAVLADKMTITAENVQTPPSAMTGTIATMNNIPSITINNETTAGFSGAYPFGESCPGTAGELQNVATTPPVIGTTAIFQLSNVPVAASQAFYLLSFQRITPGLSLAPLGAPRCFQYVGSGSVFFGASAPVANFPLPIPAAASLVGLTLYTQGAALDSINALGVITSNGLRVVIG